MSGFVDAFSELETEGLADGEQPLCDLVFDLVEPRARPVALGGRWLAGRAMAGTPRGDVGFAFELGPIASWRMREDDGLRTAWGCIAVRSVGEPTDRLVQEYGLWFDVPVTTPAANELVTPAVVIDGSPSEFDRSKIYTKLFFQHADDEESYAEVFLNIDVPGARVELREKDDAYRANLLASLQGRHGQPDRSWLQ